VGNGEILTPTGELIARGFLSFDLSEIPQGATIDNAELRFYQSEVNGDPYGKLGDLVLEHVNYGTSLGESAFGTPAIDSATLADRVPAGQWYILGGDTLTAWIQKEIGAGQTRFQLRLRFSVETDGDGQEDWVAIQPGGSFLGSSQAPLLSVTFVP
jgi:hypothetical protein